MAGLNFIDKLDEEQLANAEAVAKAAKKAGVDPMLAVAIAYKEGSLRTSAPRGSSGEIGMMQVMPATGSGMGYTEKDLADPTKNIEAGVSFLRKGLEATGNDPKLAAVYYNGGPGAVEALKADKDPDPRVYDYVRTLNSYGTFNTPVQVNEPTAQEKADIAAESQGETDEQRDARIQADMDRVAAEQDRRMGQVYGGGAGAVVSAFRLGKEKAKDIASAMGEASESGRMAAHTRAGFPAVPGGAPSMPGATPSGPPQSVVRVQPPGGLPSTQLGAPGTYPTATGPGSATFNYGRVYGLPEIEAGRALGTGKAEGEVWDLLNKRQESLNRIQQMGGGFAENPRYGGIMTPQQSVGSGPRASYVQQAPTPSAPGQAPQQGGLRALPPRQPIPTTMPKPSGLQMVTQELKSLARPVISGASTVGKYVVPPLALASAGGELADVYSETKKEEPDYIKAGLSGLTGAASLAAMYPPLTIPAGVVGGGAALINYLREKSKEKERGIQQDMPSTDYAAP